VFGARESGFYLRKFTWTKIVRHRMVPGTASTDDPALAEFWAGRRRKQKTPLGQAGLRLLQAQRGRCPACGDLLLHADREPQSPHEWEQWIKATRKAIRKHAITADEVPVGRSRHSPPDTYPLSPSTHHRHGRGPAPHTDRDSIGVA
jgi:RNA-directed DNA polymerase